VALSRRLTPYLLLGTLTLGAGLGAGLSLSEGPVTYDASAAASPVVTLQEGPCTISTGRGETAVSCTSSHGAAFSSSVGVKFTHIPARTQACLIKFLRTVGKKKAHSGVALRDIVEAISSTCR
jgi:hypothetical protein